VIHALDGPLDNLSARPCQLRTTTNGVTCTGCPRKTTCNLSWHQFLVYPHPARITRLFDPNREKLIKILDEINFRFRICWAWPKRRPWCWAPPCGGMRTRSRKRNRVRAQRAHSCTMGACDLFPTARPVKQHFLSDHATRGPTKKQSSSLSLSRGDRWQSRDGTSGGGRARRYRTGRW
jgi:hypothetical protein